MTPCPFRCSGRHRHPCPQSHARVWTQAVRPHSATSSRLGSPALPIRLHATWSFPAVIDIHRIQELKQGLSHRRFRSATLYTEEYDATLPCPDQGAQGDCPCEPMPINPQRLQIRSQMGSRQQDGSISITFSHQNREGPPASVNEMGQCRCVTNSRGCGGSPPVSSWSLASGALRGHRPCGKRYMVYCLTFRI